MLRVVDWLCANQDRPCIAQSDVGFVIPRAAWEENVGSDLEVLYLAPERLLDHPHLFLRCWVGVLEATAYILTSPISSTVVVWPHVDAP